MISSNERTMVKNLLTQPQWRLAEQIANEMCSKLKEDSIVRNTEWDTIQAALLNEGQIRGIRNFIQELYQQAQQDV